MTQPEALTEMDKARREALEWAARQQCDNCRKGKSRLQSEVLSDVWYHEIIQYSDDGTPLVDWVHCDAEKFIAGPYEGESWFS